MFEIVINFSYPIQDSVSVGDIAYYVTVSEDGGLDINAQPIVEIGEIISIDRLNKTITCSTMLTNAELPKDQPTFILFSKNNCEEMSSLLGYYSSFKFKNTSTSQAELFNVTVDAFESSK